MIPRVKGTQDFLDLALFDYITNTAATWCQQYHFTKISTPILEYHDLFVRSVGEYTDVVSKEMFLIQSSENADDARICLRPEMTAAMVRAFVDNHIQQVPWKVFSYGPCFRYERPQKGRYRQFHQFNIEVIGAPTIAYDAQLIALLDRLFHEQFGLTNYALHINFLGTATDRISYQKALVAFLSSQASHICATCNERRSKNSMRVFDCKNTDCQAVYKKAPIITDYLSEAAQAEWQQLQEYLSMLSISYSINPYLVRGLDYYNKTVFEFVSTDLGAQQAFCGGGRYDNLVHTLGASTDQPSLGAAFGIERMMMLLEPRRDQLSLTQERMLYVIVPQKIAYNALALLVAEELIARKKTVETLLDGDSMKSMLRTANKLGARYCIIIGEDEVAANEVTIKDMLNGTSQRISQAHLAQL